MSKTYEIVKNKAGEPLKGIKCAFCEWISWSDQDVKHRFCSCLAYFHTEQDFTEEEIVKIKEEYGY